MTGGAGKYTYEWKLQGFVVGTNSTYTVPTGTAVGSVISVSVTDADGISATDSVVTVEKKVELPDDQIEGAIKIEDISGLQSDGTGLVGDWLRAVVPATLGSFSNVIFYRDGIQLNSTTQNGAAMTARADRPGLYTVSVIGTDNKVYLSDSIKVVDTEAPAIIQSFAIEDDYSTPRIILSANADTEAVVSVSLNKAYAGNIRIYKATDLKYTGAADVVESTVETVTTGGAGDVDEVLAMPTTAQVTALTNGNVVFYTDPETGVTTYKFTVPTTGLARGTEYKMIFDQTAITSDTAGQGNENEAPNTATAPYLETPATMSIDKGANGEPVVISFKDANGATMIWMGAQAAPGAAANDLLSQLKVYSNTKAEMKDGTDLGASTAGSTILKGIMTTDANGDTNAYYYATAKTVAGLFGKKSVDLASSLGKGAQPAATGIAITQNSSDPYSADVKFTNLRTDGTLYIMQSTTLAQVVATDDTMKTAFDQGTQAAKISSAVTAGTEKVTLAGAIDDINTTNVHYMAIFVPDDAVNYATVYTAGAGTDDLVVAAKLTKFALSGNLKDATTASYAGVTAGGPTAEEKYLVAKDQFGNSMAFTAAEAFAAADMTDAAPTVDVGVGAKLAVALSAAPAATEDVIVGVMTFTIDSATTVDEGKSFTIVLKTGQTLTLKNKAAGSPAASTWNISIS